MRHMTSLVLLALSLVSVPAFATDDHSQSRWSSDDSVREGVFAAMLVTDMSFTIDNGMNCDEGNPIIGRCPSATRVKTYGATCLMLHAGIAAILPKPYRKIWQMSWISVEAGAIGTNVYGGARLRF